ncbi:MAG TPA: ABC transporter permease, partial [Blastocatellia bacterium]|nr:ABC transporter permease [Blastocatellia bacterium]
MNIWGTFKIALRALSRNKLRSSLTMLGIIIGVGAVIAMVAVGSGAQARVAEQIQSLGSNLIIVMSGSV